MKPIGIKMLKYLSLFCLSLYLCHNDITESLTFEINIPDHNKNNSFFISVINIANTKKWLAHLDFLIFLPLSIRLDPDIHIYSKYLYCY